MTRIHLIGIGGTGLSAIARLLIEMGHKVSGSDRVESTFTRNLQTAGATINIGHNAENVRGANLVVRSSAIADDNPEVTAARAARIPVLKRADFLGSLMDGKIGIAVAGTHGKTTTSSMIAWMLTDLGQEPTFIVGGVPANLGVNAHAGKGSTFVIEADEYDRMFLGLKPNIEVVTNIEHDHPDCFPTREDFEAAFVEFMYHLPVDGALVACADDPGVRKLIVKAGKLGKTVITYGLLSRTGKDHPLDVKATELNPGKNGGYRFRAQVRDAAVEVDLQVPGEHNVLNSLAALAVAQLLDLPLPEAARALSHFKGTQRRFELRGEVNGITVIDDYAHHPTEIRATLSAARMRFPTRRLVVVWQPHTYSRTKALASGFIGAFEQADELLVTEIYAAREPKQDFSSKQIVDAMPHPARFYTDMAEVSIYLASNLHSGDVLLVLSAGDADQISTDVLAHLKEARNG